MRFLTPRRLLKERFPFRLPECVEISELRLGDPDAPEIVVDPINNPAVYSDWQQLSCSETFENELLTSPVTSEWEAMLFERSDVTVEEVELLSKVKPLGKKYTKDANDMPDKPLVSEPVARGAEAECVHGIPHSSCVRCRPPVQRNALEESEEDQFDLLLPLLQPPLVLDLDNLDYFPDTQRPYRFQVDGIRFLLDNKRALLADEMGLGKSIQAIIALRALFKRAEITRAIILCPRSLITDWRRKLKDWAGELQCIAVTGSKRHSSWSMQKHVYICGYESFRSDADDLITEAGFVQALTKTVVILDEAQRIKNQKTDTHQAVMKLEADRRWALTGTPLENDLPDLVSILSYVAPEQIKGDALYYSSSRTAILENVMKRRRKRDVLKDLPAKYRATEKLELTQAQRECYDRLREEGVLELTAYGDKVTVQHVLALITKLKQVCNLEPVSGESCKAARLLELLEDIEAAGEKALVFSQYPVVSLRPLANTLANYGPDIYDGSVSAARRDRILEEFQKRPDKRVLLMSTKTGGLGLTIVEANHVVHLDQWWNPATMDQAEARIDRPGQTKEMFVTTFICADTIEEWIDDKLAAKREKFDSIIDAHSEDDLSDESLSRQVSEDELFEYFGIQNPRSKVRKVESIDTGKVAEMNPDEFEAYVADLYRRLGFECEKTRASRDGGVDIFALKATAASTEFLAIQCKHYPNDVVGVDAARDMFGVINADQTITQGVLVTSGRFSRDCEDFARPRRIVLRDRNWLVQVESTLARRRASDEAGAST